MAAAWLYGVYYYWVNYIQKQSNNGPAPEVRAEPEEEVAEEVKEEPIRNRR